MTKVRLAFYGVGGMGQAAHLRNYAQLRDDCEIIAAGDRVPGKAAAVAARYGIPHAYDSELEVLEKHGRDVDAVVAIGPFTKHGQTLPPVIALGKPFLIEKPLAGTVPVGRALLEQMKKSGARCMVAYHKRNDPATIHAKETIDALKASKELGNLRFARISMPPGDWTAGAFGDLVHVHAPFAALADDPRDPDYDEVKQNQYTTFVNYYVHQVNLMRHLLGEDYRFEYVDPTMVVAVGRSVGGVACALEMQTYAESIDWHETATVFFDRGYVRLELPAPMALNRSGRVTVYRDPGNGVVPTSVSPVFPNEHAMMRQAKNFLKFVRGEAPAPADAAEGLKDLEQSKEYLKVFYARS